MPSFQFMRHPEYGTVGCTIGLAPDVYIGAFGQDATDALHKAADLAAQMNALAKAHPEIASALQAIPGAGTAFAAISAASKALKYGHDIEHVVSNYGPKVAHVVSKILDIF